MVDPERASLTRRRLVTHGVRAVGGAALAAGLGGERLAAAIAAAAPIAAEGIVLPSYLADVTGNGKLVKGDEKTVRRALDSRRGLGSVVPAEGYDYRADLFGRGRVTDEDLAAVQATRAYLAANPGQDLPRPVTVAWHYGWFNHAGRPINKQHVWFTDGGYSSREPSTEALFNDLKNEFGITVDAISWADPKADGNLNANIEAGYFEAANSKTRYAALLYESLISLRTNTGDRADFERQRVRNWLVDHFRQMGQTLRRLRRRSRANVFTIDGRPVVFVYASHTWGTNVDGTGPQYDRIDEAMTNARIVFGEAYGSEPFIIGEESTFDVQDSFDVGRQRRAANFDGVFIYHHASSPDFVVRGGGHVRGDYIDQVQTVLSRLYGGIQGQVSRATGKQLLVVPSLAAGFSKIGWPTLFSNRSEYADFLRLMVDYHRDEFIEPVYGQSALRSFPPVVSVGSWNEEWEGHAVFPSQFNKSLSPRKQKGYDYVMAIKQAFGWNHYAARKLSLTLP